MDITLLPGAADKPRADRTAEAAGDISSEGSFFASFQRLVPEAELDLTAEPDPGSQAHTGEIVNPGMILPVAGDIAARAAGPIRTPAADRHTDEPPLARAAIGADDGPGTLPTATGRHLLASGAIIPAAFRAPPDILTTGFEEDARPTGSDAHAPSPGTGTTGMNAKSSVHPLIAADAVSVLPDLPPADPDRVGAGADKFGQAAAQTPPSPLQPGGILAQGQSEAIAGAAGESAQMRADPVHHPSLAPTKTGREAAARVDADGEGVAPVAAESQMAAPRIGAIHTDRDRVMATPNDLDHIAEQADAPLQPEAMAVPHAEPDPVARPAESPAQPRIVSAAPRDISHQIGEAITRFPDQPVEIALSPEELGRVRMVIAMSDGALTLQITAERPETLELMRRHAEQLAQDFRQLGFDKLDFRFGGETGGQSQPSEPPSEVHETDLPAAQPAAALAQAPRGPVASGRNLDIRL